MVCDVLARCGAYAAPQPAGGIVNSCANQLLLLALPRSLQCRSDKLRPPLLPAPAALAALGARLAVVVVAPAVVAVVALPLAAPGRAVGGGGPWLASPPAAGRYNFSHISMVGSNMWIIFPAQPPNFMCQSDADGACTA